MMVWLLIESDSDALVNEHPPRQRLTKMMGEMTLPSDVKTSGGTATYPRLPADGRSPPSRMISSARAPVGDAAWTAPVSSATSGAAADANATARTVTRRVMVARYY